MKKPRQQLVTMYDEMLRETLRNRYVVHCTDSRQVVEATEIALAKDYKEHLTRFKANLDQLRDPKEDTGWSGPAWR